MTKKDFLSNLQRLGNKESLIGKIKAIIAFIFVLIT